MEKVEAGEDHPLVSEAMLRSGSFFTQRIIFFGGKFEE